MKKTLSLRGRMALTSAALVAAACILLTVLLSSIAFAQLDSIGETVIEIDGAAFGGAAGAPLTMNMGIADLFPDLAQQLAQSRRQMLLSGIVAMGSVILIAAGCTYFLAGRALRPLRRLSDHMETVRAQNLSLPLEIPNSGDELTRLAEAFNGMLARLEESFAVQAQFTANAAHELRTPLAVIRTHLEVLQRYESPTPAQYTETFAMVLEQTGRLGDMVQTLLEMAQLDNIERTERVSLGDMAEEILCDLAPVAAEKQVTLVQGGGTAAVIGSDTLLYRAVYNLVENAIKYNRTGGTVTVSCRQEGKTAVVSVRDTGIGIPQADRDAVFRPFFRVDRSHGSTGGAGLGLALVRRIAEAHGGTVAVAESGAEGTEICLCLPSGETGGA